MPANWYASAEGNALQGNISIGTNVIKAALLKSTYVPDLLNHAKWADISANESTGTNYTAGGVTPTTPAIVKTAANAWSTAAALSTAYSVGQVVRPASANGYLYRCEAAGTSGATAPTWPTAFGATVADGSVTWTNIGTSITQFNVDPVVFSNLTCSDFRYIVFYDSTSGYLICLHDLGAAQNVSNTNVTYTPDATGVAYSFAA